ncbi:response regulator transcription factor [Mucilaginibacter sp. 14171R-50]|uniref:LytR/AlgR family response regulator transcription factor n=1 Tax=Mucilaginibacter sp. 14171R-50 TaxID=2703789 RepID=UPI00138B32AC|nr:LytTR family DNA-binding domain-containing protein [Mucilaginibacter sp. 14171R-50]QHS56560.1 response regulator transcription factor [Mucilaginibacter sp. 14171R-50]
MKNLTCLVIDDERHAAELLTTYISKTPGLEAFGLYTDPLKALEVFAAGRGIPDMTFLDIDMPELSGIDLAGMIGGRSTVIFTTSYREYGPEAFEKNAADYLLKPISYERFLYCIQKIRQERPVRELNDYFFIKTDIKGKMLRINTTDIRYIESNGNYVQLFLAKEKVIAYLTLGEILAQLPQADFSRIHRSFVVAHAYIRSVEHGQVRLQDRADTLPVGEAYREAFLHKMEAALIVSKRKLL